MPRTRRKHWLEYPNEKTCYGNHKYGFGVYLINGKDYWIDPECILPHELKRYKKYCKDRGYKDDNIKLAEKILKSRNACVKEVESKFGGKEPTNQERI